MDSLRNDLMQSTNPISNVLKRTLATSSQSLEPYFRFGLAVILLLSAISKIFTPLETVGALMVTVNVSTMFAEILTAGLVGVELFAAFLLVLHPSKRTSYSIAILLLAIFSAYLLKVSFTPRAQTCGCGILAHFVSGSIQQQALVGIVRNLVLISACVLFRSKH